jgi:hypothetical protein
MVEGKGRVFARKFGVCGKTLPDYELSWLRILQHELATQVSLLWGPTPLKRGAFLVAYGPKRDRPEGGQTLIRMSNKGFGLAPPGRPAPQGGRSWTGAPDAQTRHNRKSTVSPLYIRPEPHRGKGRCIWPHFALEKSHGVFENGRSASSFTGSGWNGVKQSFKSDSIWPAFKLWHSRW